MSHDVFVSYNEASSRNIMLQVVDQLEQHGVQCWYAPRNVQDHFASSIKRAIDNTPIFVVILNKAASESEYVMDEVALAKKKKGIKIIPLHVADTDISDEAEFYLGRFHWIEAMHDLDAGIAELTERILKELGREKRDFGDTSGYITLSYCGQTHRVKAGTITYDDGTVYTGELVKGKPHGKGKYTWISGNIYEGEWVDGVRNGKGRMSFQKGDVYEGDFKDNKRTGVGKYTWGKDTEWAGDVYEGHFVDGKRTGKGKYIYASGNAYEGDFVESKRHGKGKFTWKNGDVYEGDFLDDKRTGKGKYTWSDGAVYEGDYVNGRRNGYGVYKPAKGKILKGQFKDNKFIG